MCMYTTICTYINVNRAYTHICVPNEEMTQLELQKKKKSNHFNSQKHAINIQSICIPTPLRLILYSYIKNTLINRLIT